jgi:hypothetical protein
MTPVAQEFLEHLIYILEWTRSYTAAVYSGSGNNVVLNVQFLSAKSSDQRMVVVVIFSGPGQYVVVPGEW